MKSVVFATAPSFIGAAAAADPDRLSVLLGAHHVGASGFEEFTPGLFLSWEGAAETSIGIFSNSYGDLSPAATLAWSFATWEGGTAQVFGGAAWYENAEEASDIRLGNIVPLAGVQVRQGPLFTQFILMDGTPVDAIFTFGVTTEFSFGR